MRAADGGGLHCARSARRGSHSCRAAALGTRDALLVLVTPYRIPAPATRPPAVSGAHDLWPALLAVAIGSAAYSWCTNADDGAAFDAMTDSERAGVLERTLINLQLCGGDRATALREFCEAEADRALGLPECGEACRAEVGARVPQPPRGSSSRSRSR